MPQFSLLADVDQEGNRYRAHIVLWDGRVLERFQNTADAAAADLGLALAEEMKVAGLPSARLQALLPIEETGD